MGNEMEKTQTENLGVEHHSFFAHGTIVLVTSIKSIFIKPYLVPPMKENDIAGFID